MKRILILIIIALTIFVIFNRQKAIAPSPDQAGTATEPTERAMTLEDYLRLNISEISNQAGTPEVLGGKFFVTDIKAAEGAGLVSYEDGHNAYSANFTYTIAENGAITITSFKVRP